MNPEDIKQQALAEIFAEQHRIAIDKTKERIRKEMNGKKWWHKIVPFTIKLEWRNK